MIYSDVQVLGFAWLQCGAQATRKPAALSAVTPTPTPTPSPPTTATPRPTTPTLTPTPIPPPEPASSSMPVGAIVGGVIGGIGKPSYLAPFSWCAIPLIRPQPSSASFTSTAASETKSHPLSSNPKSDPLPAQVKPCEHVWMSPPTRVLQPIKGRPKVAPHSPAFFHHCCMRRIWAHEISLFCTSPT